MDARFAMSDVRKDIEKGIRRTAAKTTPEYQEELRKWNEYMKNEGKLAHDWTQESIGPNVLYPIGGLVGGAFAGSVFGGKLKRLFRGKRGVPKTIPSSLTGATIGGAIGGPAGVYGSLRHQELRRRNEKKRRK
jgi:hypothetical protein